MGCCCGRIRWLHGSELGIGVARLAVCNGCALFLAVGIGLMMSDPGRSFSLVNVPQHTDEAIQLFRTIAARNLSALVVLMVFGVVSGGVFSVMAVAWNGYSLGSVLGSLFGTCPAIAFAMLLYVPLEFAAMVAGSTASGKAGLVWVEWSQGADATSGWQSAGRCCRLSVALLLVAAVVEVAVGCYGMVGCEQ